jgi:hypothetical protein
MPALCKLGPNTPAARESVRNQQEPDSTSRTYGNLCRPRPIKSFAERRLHMCERVARSELAYPAALQFDCQPIISRSVTDTGSAGFSRVHKRRSARACQRPGLTKAFAVYRLFKGRVLATNMLHTQLSIIANEPQMRLLTGPDRLALR